MRLPAVIRTQGALLEGRAAWGEAGWWALRNWEVHGAEERGARLEQRNSGAGRKEKLTRWGRSVRGRMGERERAGRWGQARREGDADCGA